MRTKFVLGAIGWLALVTVLHLWLNMRAFDRDGPRNTGVFRVGFIPVT